MKILTIYDDPLSNGINIEFDLENGMKITFSLCDELAQEMVNTIQTKLEARLT